MSTPSCVFSFFLIAKYYKVTASSSSSNQFMGTLAPPTEQEWDQQFYISSMLHSFCSASSVMQPDFKTV